MLQFYQLKKCVELVSAINNKTVFHLLATLTNAYVMKHSLKKS
jgi:hypothetical protein